MLNLVVKLVQLNLVDLATALFSVVVNGMVLVNAAASCLSMAAT